MNHARSASLMVLRPFCMGAMAAAQWCTAPAIAGDVPGKLAMNAERVAVFKDGYALVAKKARGIADAAGTVHTLEVPDAAVLGTFWVLADGGGPVIARAEYMADEVKEGPCLSVLDLVRANVGKHVTLDGNRRLTGTIVAVLESEQGAGRGDAESALRWPVAPHAGVPFVVLETTAQERVIFPVSDVQTITGPGLATTTMPQGPAPRHKRLTFDLGKGAAGKPVVLTVFYFTPGVRWVPTYRLEGVGGPKADMFLQGEIINDLEDFKGASFDLVAGVPNFKFKDAVSPLSLEAAIRQTMAQNEQMRGVMSQRLSNVAYDDRGRREDEAASPPVPGEITAAPEQDLFVYPMGVLNLAKGARAAVPIWSNKPAVRHVYTLDIRAVKGEHGMSLYGSADPGGPATVSDSGPEVYRVWHQLELTNPGPSPWTTGPAMVMQDGLPISQDVLRYVPSKGVGRLALTVALDVRGTYREEEIERVPDALRIDRREYTKVRKRATVTLKNIRAEASSVCATVSVAGAASAPSHNGTVTIDTWRPQDRDFGIEPRANNHSDLKWEVKVEPGQSVELTFEYTVFL